MQKKAHGLAVDYAMTVQMEICPRGPHRPNSSPEIGAGLSFWDVREVGSFRVEEAGACGVLSGSPKI